MATSRETYDVVVVGGGFAGVTAARDLTEQGHSVLLLEARDRLGGRTWTRNFADTDLVIDMGGAWLSPECQTYIMAEMERYGLGVERSPAARSYPTLVAGRHRDGPIPVPMEEIFDLERAVYAMVMDASQIELGVPLDRQVLKHLDIPYSEYLDRLNLPPATRDYLGAIAALFLGRYPRDCSALHVLSVVQQLGGSMVRVWGLSEVKIEGGTKRLIDAIAADAGAEIRLNCPVERVDQDDSGVSVTTSSGDVVRASCAIIATPMACWNDIEFSPALSRDKQEASAERHVARAGKVWAQVKSASRFPYMVAGPESTRGAITYSAEHDLGEEGQVVVGFLVREPDDPENLDNTTFAGTEQFVKTMAPDADVVKVDGHDWLADPYSKGGWAAFSAGRLSKSHSVLGRPENRLYFATSDVAHGQFSWMDGAIEMGLKAATAVTRATARNALSIQVGS